MGWTWTHKPKGMTASTYLINRCLIWTGSEYDYKVLDSAVVKLRTFYAAVEQVHRETGERKVWAAVFLLGYAPSSYHNFGYKDMDESCGPCEGECPERILKLLTPTEYKHAQDWRERCWKRINDKKARPKIVVGAIVTLYGKQYKIHTALKKNWLVVGQHDGLVYNMTHAKARQVTDVVSP